MALKTCTLYFKAPGDILQVDRDFETLFGYSSHEIVGKTLDEVLIPVSQRDLYHTMLQSNAVSGSPAMDDILSSIVQFRSREGDTVNVRLDAQEQHMSPQSHYVVHVQLAEIDCCTLTFDFYGSIIGCRDHQLSNLFGYSEKDLKGLRVSQLLPTLRREREDYGHLVGVDLADEQINAKDKGGGTFPVRLQIQTFGAGTNVVFCAKVFRISEIVQAVLRTSSTGEIIDCNDQVRTLFGFNKEELNGEHLSRILPEEEGQPEANGRKRRRSSVDLESFYKEDVVRVKTKCGSLIYVNCTRFSTVNHEYLLRFYPNDNQQQHKIGPYELDDIVAQGSYGLVMKAVHTKTKMIVAVKSIKKEAVFRDKLCTSREMDIMRGLNHPNIVQLLDAFETEDKIHIVTEFIRGRCLKEVLLKEAMPVERVKNLFQQVISAICYCHSRNVFHRDIKPSNILVTDGDRVKVIDFGLSNVSSLDKLQSTFCGSPAFAAPEIILGTKYDGKRADIWSLGVLLYTMLTGKLPFDTVKEVLQPHPKIPQTMDPACAELLLMMLNGDSEKRIRIEDAATHPWLSPTSTG